MMPLTLITLIIKVESHVQHLLIKTVIPDLLSLLEDVSLPTTVCIKIGEILLCYLVSCFHKTRIKSEKHFYISNFVFMSR